METGSAAAAGVDIDPAVVRIDDLANDRQSQPRSLRLGRKERAENPVLHLSGHTGTAVGNVDDDEIRSLRWLRPLVLFGGGEGCSDPNLTLPAQGLERVDQQVREQLPKLDLIALDAGQVVGHIHRYLDAVPRRLGVGDRQGLA